MTTDHIELVWDCGCAGTAQTSSGSRLEVGRNGRWSAEQLLMAAAESALMTSFVALAEAEALDVLGYVSSAGTERGGTGSGSIRLALRPCIVVASETDRARAQDVLARSLDRSSVLRALTGAVRVDPQVVVVEST